MESKKHQGKDKKVEKKQPKRQEIESKGYKKRDQGKLTHTNKEFEGMAKPEVGKMLPQEYPQTEGNYPFDELKGKVQGHKKDLSEPRKNNLTEVKRKKK